MLEVAEGLNDLAEKHLNRKSTIVFEKERKGEVRRNHSDIGKAKKILGFEPNYDLRQGLEKAFVWFLENTKEKRGIAVREWLSSRWRS